MCPFKKHIERCIVTCLLMMDLGNYDVKRINQNVNIECVFWSVNLQFVFINYELTIAEVVSIQAISLRVSAILMRGQI